MKPFPKDLSLIDDFTVQNYWRVMFALPVAFAIIQCFCLLTVFNYESPKFMKQNKQDAKLNLLMGRIYQADRVRERIDLIVIEEGGQSEQPGYGATLCHPKYKYATLIGCTLSAL